MSRIRLTLEFDRYLPEDHDPFRRKGGDWLTVEQFKDKIDEAVSKVIGLMDREDQIAITIETTPEPERG